MKSFSFCNSDYAKPPWQEQQPEQVWAQACVLLGHLSRIQPGTKAAQLLNEHARLSVSTSIYFSNLIEEKGMPLDATEQLVQSVLEGSRTSSDAQQMAGNSASGSTQRADGKLPDEVATAQPKASEASKASGGGSQQRDPHSDPEREVVQHAAAHVLLADHMVTRQQPLSEDLILKAHAILMADLKTEDGTSAQAGQYRIGPAYAGNHQFPPPDSVKPLLLQLVKQYNEQSSSDDVDPFVLAASLSYRFVAIHPFVDGNGRMCRLLLNMALLTHGVPFCNALGFASGHKRAKRHYLGDCIVWAQRHGDNTGRLAFVVLCAFRDTAVAYFTALKQEAPEQCPPDISL